MTFFPDLSPFTYAHCTESLLPTAERAVNIGWLGEGRVVPVGDTSDAFRAALELICANHVVRAFFRGYHDCEYCPEAAREQGKGEIWVRGANGCWYAAPKLILHYVTAHGYRPPDEFIEAVLHPSEIGKDPEMLTLTEAAELRLDPEFAAMVRLLDSPPTDVDATARPLPDPPDEAARPWWRFWQTTLDMHCIYGRIGFGSSSRWDGTRHMKVVRVGGVEVTTIPREMWETPLVRMTPP